MSFEFPPVEAGDSVLYARSPGVSDWQAAHVVRVNNGTIDAIIMVSTGDQIGQMPRVNVRHIDDPWLRDPANITTMAEDGGMGVFQLRHKDLQLAKRLRDLESNVERLESSIETLYQAQTDSPKRKREQVAA